MPCTISPFPAADERIHERAAWLLVESFRENWPNAWPTMADGLEEVAECLDGEMICLGAFSADHTLLGWIGARPQYDGNVWELHPLVVDEAARGEGIGRMLVRALEAAVAARGGGTIFLGTDDENGMTSLAGADLYADLWGQIARIRNLRRHPFGFYQKLGYTIVGVIPDANGPGKPDILMAKRVPMDN
jgi:aminoglycoside 6'-N-acetyltransferase I